MLKYQADFLLWVSGIFVCWALIFFFFQSLSSPVSQKYTNSQDYYFFFLPALFCCHQNASALLFPSCFAHSYLTASYTALPQGQHRVHPRAQQNRGYDFSFNASSSARSSNCRKMNPTLMM